MVDKTRLASGVNPNLERELRVELARGGAAMSQAGEKSDEIREANLAFGAQARILRETEDTGDLAGLLRAERLVLAQDLSVANDVAERASIEQGFDQLEVTMGLAEKVRDPEAYRREVDQAHQFTRNREGGLPIDEARQFFRSHAVRLRNLRSGYGLTNQKRVVEGRERNMRTAARAYIALQRDALGHPPPSRSRETPGLER